MRRSIAAALLAVTLCAGIGVTRAWVSAFNSHGVVSHRIADDANPPLPYSGQNDPGNQITTSPDDDSTNIAITASGN